MIPRSIAIIIGELYEIGKARQAIIDEMVALAVRERQILVDALRECAADQAAQLYLEAARHPTADPRPLDADTLNSRRDELEDGVVALLDEPTFSSLDREAAKTAIVEAFGARLMQLSLTPNFKGLA